MMDLTAFKETLTERQRSIMAADHPDELLGMLPQRERGQDSPNEIGQEIAMYARCWNPELLRALLPLSKEVRVSLFANSTLTAEWVIWCLGELTRMGLKGDYRPAQQYLDLLGIVARRGALNLPPWTLHVLYQGLDVPKNYKGPEGAHCRKIADSLYSEVVAGATPERQSHVVTQMFRFEGWDPKDENGQEVAQSPYTEREVLLGLLQGNPTRNVFLGTFASPHLQDPEVRARLLERARAEPDLYSWLVVYPNRADFSESWEGAVKEKTVERLFRIPHFPYHTLAWLSPAQQAALLAHEDSEVRMKAMLEIGRAKVEEASPPVVRRARAW